MRGADSAGKLLRRITALAHGVPAETVRSVCDALETLPPDATPEAIGTVISAVPNVAARRELWRVVEAWRAVPSPIALQALSWALRAAATTDDWWREAQALDLVWTGPNAATDTLRKTEQALLEVVDGAEARLWLVSFAGYKVPNVKRALEIAAERGVDVRLILETEQASGGKLTFDALKGIGAKLAEIATVYYWPLEQRLKSAEGYHGKLHVKCALADEQLLFVSSANLTEHAMNLNMELGVLVRGGEAPRRLSRHLFWLTANGVLAKAPKA